MNHIGSIWTYRGYIVIYFNIFLKRIIIYFNKKKRKKYIKKEKKGGVPGARMRVCAYVYTCVRGCMHACMRVCVVRFPVWECLSEMPQDGVYFRFKALIPHEWHLYMAQVEKVS